MESVFTLSLVMSCVVGISHFAKAQDEVVEGEATCIECDARKIDPMQTFKTYSDTRKLLGAIYANAGQNACVDFYAATCVETPPVDPTGTVMPMLDSSLNVKTYERQQAAIRSIVADWNKSDKSVSKYNYVIKEYYKRNDFDAKIDKWESILQKVKTEIMSFLEEKIKDKRALDEAREILKHVKILRDYQSDPGMLFETTAVSGMEITVGGNMLLTVTSDHAIAQTLAHEMGHNLSGLGDVFFASTKSCIAEKFSKIRVINRPVSTEEIWADWFSHQIYARIYDKPSIPNEEKLAGLKNALRFFCGYGGSTYGHPTGNFRLNFMAANPILSQIACKNFKGEAPKKEYCQ